ncbi:MAG: hypothetical protein GXP49_05535 [Deltaproteobacteria bacterium]|nr:hypothetical protein [Deltaproteobacteria bacterium]
MKVGKHTIRRFRVVSVPLAITLVFWFLTSCNAYWSVLDNDASRYRLVVNPDFGTRGNSQEPVKFYFTNIEPMQGGGICYITRLEFSPKDVWADNVNKLDDCTGFNARVTVAEDAGPDGPRRVFLTFMRRGPVFEELDGEAMFYVVGGKGELNVPGDNK